MEATARQLQHNAEINHPFDTVFSVFVPETSYLTVCMPPWISLKIQIIQMACSFFCNKYYYVTLGNKCLVSITKKLCITFLVKSSFSRWLHFVFCQASQLGGRHH